MAANQTLSGSCIPSLKSPVSTGHGLCPTYLRSSDLRFTSLLASLSLANSRLVLFGNTYKFRQINSHLVHKP